MIQVCENTKKGIPILCAKGGRFNYFKAELMKNGQMIQVCENTIKVY